MPHHSKQALRSGETVISTDKIKGEQAEHLRIGSWPAAMPQSRECSPQPTTNESKGRKQTSPFADADGLRRSSAPTGTNRQTPSIVEEESEHDGGEESQKTAEPEGEELESLADLGYTVVRPDYLGRPIAQRHWILLDDAEVKQARFLRDDHNNLHRLATEGLDRKTVPGTEVSCIPAGEHLRPAFVALFDYTNDLRAKASEQESTVKRLQGAMKVSQNVGPATPEWIKSDEDAGQYGLAHKLKKQEREFAQLKQQFKQQNETTRGRAIDALQDQINSLKDDNKRLIEQLRSASTRDASTKLRSSARRASKPGPNLESRLLSTQKELMLARRHKRNREVELETEQRRATKLQRQVWDLEKRSQLSMEQLDQHMRQKLAGFEEEYSKLKEQRDRLKDMCRSNLQQLKQIAEWQRSQQKVQQVYFEAERTKSFEQRQQLKAAGEAYMPADPTWGVQHNTTNDLRKFKKNVESPIEPSQASDGTPKSHNGIDVVRANATTKKPKPTPIHTPPAPTSRLPEATRSPKELAGIPSEQLERLPEQQTLDDYPHAPDPSVLTSLWEDYARDPIQFTSRAKIMYDVFGRDRTRQKHLFRQNDRVFVFVDSMKAFWPVKRVQEQEASQYLLHRTAMALICPHDEDYKKHFLVVADAEVVSDNGEPSHPLVRGQIVQCAHSANTKPLADDRGVLICCVQIQDGNVRGWVPASVLQRLDFAHTTSRSSNDSCLCEQPQPYTGLAIVHKYCSPVDSSFPLKENDYLDVAHEGRPSSKGLFCVRNRRTGLRGYVAGVNLMVLKQPLAEDLADGHELVLDLTPKYLPVTSEDWVAGEEVPFERSQTQQPPKGWFSTSGLPYSQEARQAWENGIQGTNPRSLKWSDAEDLARPNKVMHDLSKEYYDNGKYVTLADFLTAGLGSDIPLNPYGPSTGFRRARSQSLFDERENRILKYGPHIGYQPDRRLLGDSELPDRGYDSEPMSDEAKSKIVRSTLYKKVDGTMQVVSADEDVDVHDLDLWQENGGTVAKYGNRLKNGGPSRSVRNMDGSLYARGPDFVPSALAAQQLPRSQEEPYGTPTSEAHLSLLSATDTEALKEILKDMETGCALVYGLKNVLDEQNPPDAPLTQDDRFELHVTPEGLPIVEGAKLMVGRLPAEALDYGAEKNADTLRINPSDLDWSQPFLRQAIDTNESDTRVVLLHRSKDVEKWKCWSGDDIYETSGTDLELLPVEQWPALADVHKAIEQTKRRLVLDHGTPSLDCAPSTSASFNPGSSPPDSVSSTQPDRYLSKEEAADKWLDITEPHPEYLKGEWDVLFPVREAQAVQGPPFVLVDTDDHVYLGADQGNGYQLCEVLGTGAKGLIPKHAVDTNVAGFLQYSVKCDLGMSSNWVIVLKRKSDMLFCSLPDGSKRWFYTEDLPLDNDEVQFVTLQRLLQEDLLRVDGLEPSDSARATEMLEGEATPQFGDAETEPTQGTQQHWSRPAGQSLSHAGLYQAPSSDVESGSSTPDPKVQTYSSPPFAAESKREIGPGHVPLDLQGRTESAQESKSRRNTLSDPHQEPSSSFNNISDATVDAQDESDSSAELSPNPHRPVQALDEHKDPMAETKTGNGEDEADRLVVAYDDYKDLKDVCSAIVLDYGRLLTNLSRLTKTDPIPMRMSLKPSLHLCQ